MKQRKKKCKQCSKQFLPFRTTQTVCSAPCAILYAKEQKISNKETIQKLTNQKIDRVWLSKVLKQTQIVFNKYIRLRDKGKRCISSNIPYKYDFDAGHLFSVKQYSGIRFNELNVHGQSILDNRYKEGNFESYIISVQDRIGIDKYRELEKMAMECKRTPKKWSIPEVLEIKRHYLEKCKELEQAI